MFLLDTDVISEARKASGDAGVKEWRAGVSGEQLYLSVLTVGEIRQGIERLRGREPDQAAVFEEWLLRLCRDYSERIIPVNANIAGQWGRLNASAPLPAVDGLLAATAMVRKMTLVTRNTADVSRTGAKLLNPFV